MYMAYRSDQYQILRAEKVKMSNKTVEFIEKKYYYKA